MLAFLSREVEVINFAICWESLKSMCTFNSENYIDFTQSAGNLSFLIWFGICNTELHQNFACWPTVPNGFWFWPLTILLLQRCITKREIYLIYTPSPQRFCIIKMKRKRTRVPQRLHAKHLLILKLTENLQV